MGFFTFYAGIQKDMLLSRTLILLFQPPKISILKHMFSLLPSLDSNLTFYRILSQKCWNEKDQVIFNSQIYILRLFQPTLLLLSSKKVVPWLPLCRFLFENGWAMTRTGHSILSLTSKHELPTHAFFSADLLGPAYANIDIVQKKTYTPLECCL